LNPPFKKATHQKRRPRAAIAPTKWKKGDFEQKKKQISHSQHKKSAGGKSHWKERSPMEKNVKIRDQDAWRLIDDCVDTAS
jgi:hypothetical protein